MKSLQLKTSLSRRKNGSGPEPAIEPSPNGDARKVPKAASDLRIAWVTPSLERGYFMQPLFREFAKRFPGTVIFTGCWPGFVSGCRDSFRVRELIGVGFRPRPKTSPGNPRGFITASPLIFFALWRFRPDLVFVRGFDLCTIYAILLKVLTRCSLVLLWGGVGPHVTYLDSPVRLALRRLTARWFDHSMSHTKDGVDYLREVVEISPGKLSQYPYQPADRGTLSGREKKDTVPAPTSTEADFKSFAQVQSGLEGVKKCWGQPAAPIASLINRDLGMAACGSPRFFHSPSAPIKGEFDSLSRPVFLFVGRLIREKGLYTLMEACSLLAKKNAGSFSVAIVGRGPEKERLQAVARNLGVDDRISWVGAVDYSQLGACYQASDVFVFPSLEDIIGMVVPEAMVFGKPVLCSDQAGAKDMVYYGRNGFVFDPNDSQQLAHHMARFVNEPDLIRRFGAESKKIISPFTRQASARRLGSLVHQVLGLATDGTFRGAAA